MRAVNLLPKEAARTTSLKPTLPVVVAAAAPLVAGGLVAAGYMLEHSSVTSARGRLQAVQAQVAALPKTPATNTALDAIVLERVSRQSALDMVLTAQVPWDRTFVDLARVLPKDVWLTALSVNSPTPADSTATGTTGAPAVTSSPNAFSISGYTFSQDSVARLLTRLQLLPMLSNVTLGSTTAGSVGTKPVVQFSVTAAIVPPTSESAT